jgi:hypothetical protein
MQCFEIMSENFNVHRFIKNGLYTEIKLITRMMATMMMTIMIIMYVSLEVYTKEKQNSWFML